MKSKNLSEGRARFATNNELIRLQRNRRDLMQLNQKLNSYTCEPCTPGLYEEVQTLKSRLEHLRKSNLKLIDSIKEHKQTFDNISEVVMKQIRDFNELRRGVADYSRVASYH